MSGGGTKRRPDCRMTARTRLRLATVLFLLLGAWRLLSLVAHEPIYGYANQFDMARTSACLDLWPALQSASASELVAATAAGPLADYQIRVVPGQPCYYSAEAAFDRAVLWLRALISTTPEVDLRVIGVSKACALLLSALFCAWLLRSFAVAGLAHASLFGLVLCDPMVSLYANSLYTEFCAVWGAYLFLTCFAVYTLAGGEKTRGLQSNVVPCAIGAVIGMAILSGSRVPNAVLSVALCLIAIIFLWRWRGSARFGIGLLLATAGGVWIAVNNQQGSESIQRANAANTLLFTFMPASGDPGALMRQLELHESCQRYGFSSWYLNRGVAISEPCQRLYTFSRLHLALAVLGEPMMGVRVLANAFAQSRGWRVRYMGEVGGTDYQLAPHWSLADSVPSLPYHWYLRALFLALAGALALWFVPIVVREPHKPTTNQYRCLQSLGALFAALLVLPVLISLIGDGYTELPRHAHLSTLVVLPIYLVATIGAIGLWRAHHQRTVLWTLGIVLFSSLLGVLGFMRQASALGIWEHTLWAHDQQRIDGSVIDPYGVALAYARAEGHPDQLVTFSQPGKDVSQVFQGYPVSTKLQGTIKVHAPYTEIVVLNHIGVETVVDRIWPSKN